MKQLQKWPWIILGCLALALQSCLMNDAQTKRGTIIDNEAQYGRILEEDGEPAINAKVLMIPVDFSPSQTNDTSDGKALTYFETATDASGEYSFAGVPEGRYNLVAESEGKGAFLDSLAVDDESGELPDGILLPSGGISGKVVLQPNHDPRSVEIQVLGTLKYAVPEQEGRFQLAGLPPGQYTARVKTSLSEYGTLLTPFEIRQASSDSLESPWELPYFGIPVTTGLSASFDTLHSRVELTWDSSTYLHLQEYLVFRDQSPSLELSKAPIAIVTEPRYTDTLVLSRSVSQDPIPTFEYRVKIRDKSDHVGESYGKVTLATPGPGWVSTRFEWDILERSWDSETAEEIVRIHVQMSNPTRGLSSFTWLAGPDSTQYDNFDLGGENEFDVQFEYQWKAQGPYFVYLLSEDDAGTTWIDSIALVANSAPSIQGSPATTIPTFGNYLYEPRVSDIDGDSVLLRIENAPSWAVFDSRTGALSGKPSPADIGVYPEITIEASDGKLLSNRVSFDLTVTKSPWEPIDTLSFDHNKMNLVTMDGKLYFVGWDIYEYLIEQKSHTKISELSQDIRYFDRAAAFGTIIAISGAWELGGDEEFPHLTFNPNTLEWGTLPDNNPNWQKSGCLAVVKDRLYHLLSGQLWSIAADDSMWTHEGDIPDLPQNKNLGSHSCTEADGKLVFLVSREYEAEMTSNTLVDVYSYNPESELWTTYTPRKGPSLPILCSYGSSVFAIGGRNSPYLFEKLDWATGQWEILDALPVSTPIGSCATLDDGIFLLQGNRNDPGSPTELWKFTP